jgi:hypothetical protein
MADIVAVVALTVPKTDSSAPVLAVGTVWQGLPVTSESLQGLIVTSGAQVCRNAGKMRQRGRLYSSEIPIRHSHECQRRVSMQLTHTEAKDYIEQRMIK